MLFMQTSVYNILNAVLGARNPMQSQARSDSKFKGMTYYDDNGRIENTIIGEKDMALLQSLVKGGSEHRKFMRQIFVSVVITAPLYWWKEFDTYKVGTVENSTSTMHKLASTPITLDCFEMGDFEALPCNLDNVETIPYCTEVWSDLLKYLEYLRNTYNETKDKRYWKELIRLLPESWLQTRTVTMNYENVRNMVQQRRNHKLTEWSESFIGWAKTLPYAQELIFYTEER
jgi:hypothetical protein